MASSSTAPPTRKRSRVIIIGGGVAGLSAANALIRNGNFEVTLLEGGNRIGGRVQSLPLGEHFIENGAQWVHGNVNNSVYAQVQPLGLLGGGHSKAKFITHSVLVTEGGTLLTKDKVSSIWKVLSNVYAGPRPSNCTDDKESLGQWAEKLFWRDEEILKLSKEEKELASKILNWQHRFQTSIDGADNWFEPSCKGQQEYWECSGNPVNAWKPPACYASFLNLLVHGEPSYAPKLLPDTPKWILLGKEVVEINYKDKDVKVRCADGSIYSCDHAICTVSLGVLKKKVDSLFLPPLPEQKVKAVKHLSIGCVNKFHFDFPRKWWPDNIAGFNLLWNQPEKYPELFDKDTPDERLLEIEDGFPLWCRGIFWFHVLNSHPTALMSWMTGPTARLIEKLEDTIVRDTFIKVLRKFVGSSFEIPEPRSFQQSKWFQNPLTRGSYSFRSVDSEKNNVWATDLAAPVIVGDTPVLCFAGEATHIHFYSTVHGAHDSGLREAQRLINFVEGLKEDNISPMFPYTEDMFSNSESESSESSSEGENDS